MNKMHAPALLCLLLAAPAWAQDPGPAPLPVAPIYARAVITVPRASIPAGVPLVAFGDESQSAEPLQWSLIAPEGPYEVYDQPDEPDDPRTGARGRKGVKGALFLVRKPQSGATYKLALVASGSDGKERFAFKEIRVNPATPPNPPPPGPGPSPAPIPPPAPPNPGPTPTPPAPIAAGWHATLVRPTSPPDLARSVAPLAESPTIAAAVSALGGNWHVVTVGSAEFSRQQLGAVLAKGDPPGTPVTPPCLVIQDAAGVVLKLAVVDVSKGDTEPAVLDYLRTATGAK